jgi:hypothetical protein
VLNKKLSGLWDLHSTDLAIQKMLLSLRDLPFTILKIFKNGSNPLRAAKMILEMRDMNRNL